MTYFIEIFIGVAGGIAVGGAFAAILTVLDVIPRLAQVTMATKNITIFQSAIVLGTVMWTIIDFFSIDIHLGIIGVFVYGFFGGIFTGLLAAGLTEVFNVLPVMSRRLKMTNYIMYFVMALIAGKVSGSLFYWIIFVNIK